MKTNTTTAFSLVELLTLIAIVAILASIAAPNFLTAQTRSDVSRANSDLRAISMALGAYHIDTNKYPWCTSNNIALAYGPGRYTNASNIPTLERLTTPVSYLGSAQSFIDPFDPDGQYTGALQNQLIDLPTGTDGRPVPFYWYTCRNRIDESAWTQLTPHDIDPFWWFLQSAGPDRKFNFTFPMLNGMSGDSDLNRIHCLALVYDPTNGTTSYGGIWRFGGDPSGCAGNSFYYAAAKAKYGN